MSGAEWKFYIVAPSRGWVGGWVGGGSVQSMVSHWGESPLSVTRGDTAGWIAPGGLIVKESNLDAPLEKREGHHFVVFILFAFHLPALPDPADPIYTLAQPALFFSIASTTLHLYWTYILLYNKIIVALIHTVSVFSLNRNNFKALMTLFSWAAKLRILFQNSPSHSVRRPSQLSHENLCQYI